MSDGDHFGFLHSAAPTHRKCRKSHFKFLSKDYGRRGENKRNLFWQNCFASESVHFGFLHSAAPTPRKWWKSSLKFLSDDYGREGENKRNPFWQICFASEGEPFGFLHSAAPTPRKSRKLSSKFLSKDGRARNHDRRVSLSCASYARQTGAYPLWISSPLTQCASLPPARHARDTIYLFIYCWRHEK